MHKYLVQTIHSDHFNVDILATVYEVLKLIEDIDYGTIAIVKNNTDEGWKIECHFLEEFLQYDYKFSDDKYKKDCSRLLKELEIHLKELQRKSENYLYYSMVEFANYFKGEKND